MSTGMGSVHHYFPVSIRVLLAGLRVVVASILISAFGRDSFQPCTGTSRSGGFTVKPADGPCGSIAALRFGNGGGQATALPDKEYLQS